jgi:hypothetical protein
VKHAWNAEALMWALDRQDKNITKIVARNFNSAPDLRVNPVRLLPVTIQSDFRVNLLPADVASLQAQK